MVYYLVRKTADAEDRLELLPDRDAAINSARTWVGEQDPFDPTHIEPRGEKIYRTAGQPATFITWRKTSDEMRHAVAQRITLFGDVHFQIAP